MKDNGSSGSKTKVEIEGGNLTQRRCKSEAGSASGVPTNSSSDNEGLMALELQRTLAIVDYLVDDANLVEEISGGRGNGVQNAA
ncbi:uncharacterized protein A4U43_C03F20380 [Asparagus officinalis]|uniref:Uncharacterized protein n=1 Tax=Asparagus officinalis TaxID=4686 RepID=A0A5P1FGL9_ASPOF|nr:uncharacterized protein A4U43_C03F20380 [Asparagus officinalis]